MKLLNIALLTCLLTSTAAYAAPKALYTGEGLRYLPQPGLCQQPTDRECAQAQGEINRINEEMRRGQCFYGQPGYGTTRCNDLVFGVTGLNYWNGVSKACSDKYSGFPGVISTSGPCGPRPPVSNYFVD